MNLEKIYDQFSISFEIFPPKTAEGEKNLFKELDTLVTYKPAFISVTYGAGGSTRDKTIDLALEIRKRYGISPLVHFTCVGAGRTEIREYLKRVKSVGLTDILALRGDPPRGQDDFIPAPDGFSYANDLIAFIKEEGGFSIAVAGYPEGHPSCVDFDTDVLNLKKKIDAGAEIVLTQLFFNNADYFRLAQSLKQLGVDLPVIPGIIPITALSQIERFTQLSGAKVPAPLMKKLNECKTPEEVTETGIAHAVAQCKELITAGVKGFHMYPLNKAYAITRILDELGFPHE